MFGSQTRSAWAGVDYLRSFALSGFPWATLGYAQHQNPLLMGLAPVTSVYGRWQSAS